MKAIVFEGNDGVKNFIVFDITKKLFEVFGKICTGSGGVFCSSEEEFENLKNESDYILESEIIYKKFLGIGMYDYNGNLHEKILQPEGSYWIEDFSEQSKDITITKTKLDFVFLN